MKKVIGVFGTLGLLGIAAMLMGPSGGYPSQPTFQNVTVAGGTGNPNIANTQFFVSGGTPETDYINSAAATDQKAWDTYEDSSGTLHSRALSDSLGSAQNYLDITRTALNITGLSICAGCNASAVVSIKGVPMSQTFDATLAAGGVTVNSSAGLGTVAGTRSGVGIYQITATVGTITRAACSQRSNGGIPAVIQIESLGSGVINVNTYTLGGALSDVTGSWMCTVT